MVAREGEEGGQRGEHVRPSEQGFGHQSLSSNAASLAPPPVANSPSYYPRHGEKSLADDIKKPFRVFEKTYFRWLKAYFTDMDQSYCNIISRDNRPVGNPKRRL
jgi:hypothetical protein